VYLNQATLADLRRLPGVGAKRAQAILALRDRIQHFRQIEDLLKVKGIGRASLRKLRPLVRLDLPPPLVDAGGGSS
jgi:competence protein ComEA